MPHPRIVILPLLAGVLCFLLSAAMIKYLSFQGNLASVWPSNAVILALLLGRERRNWAPFVLSGFLATMAAGAATRGTWTGPVGFAVINMVEVTLAAWLLRRSIENSGRLLHHHASVGRFVVCAGFVAPAVGGLLGAGMAAIAFGLPMGISFATKFSADALGLLIFTPFFFGLF